MMPLEFAKSLIELATALLTLLVVAWPLIAAGVKKKAVRAIKCKIGERAILFHYFSQLRILPLISNERRAHG